MMEIQITPTLLPDMGSDKHLRNQFFIGASYGHPAKLHLGLLAWIIDTYTLPGQTIADPMCGAGGIFYATAMARNVIAREIEPRWLEIAHLNAAHIIGACLFAGAVDLGQSDARESWGYQADHIVFSPPYGNEMGTTASGRRMLPYKLHAGTVPYGERWQKFLKQPNAGTAGAVVFHYGSHPQQIGHYRGKRYLAAMEQIYCQAKAALRPGGFLILILKDHIYQGQRVETARNTIQICDDVGFSLHAWHQRPITNPALWQRIRKEKGQPVVEEEDVLVFCHAT